MALALRERSHHVFDPADPLCYSLGPPSSPTGPAERLQALRSSDVMIAILPGDPEVAALLGTAHAQEKRCALVGTPGPGEWAFCQLWPSTVLLEADAEIAGLVARWEEARASAPRRRWGWLPWRRQKS